MTAEDRWNEAGRQAFRLAIEATREALSEEEKALSADVQRQIAFRRLVSAIVAGRNRSLTEAYVQGVLDGRHGVSKELILGLAGALGRDPGEILFEAEHPDEEVMLITEGDSALYLPAGFIGFRLRPEIAGYLAGALRGEPWPPQARGELEALLRELEGAEEGR